jgi:hypothetical protein
MSALDLEALKKVAEAASVAGLIWLTDAAPTGEVIARHEPSDGVSVVAKVNPMAEWDDATEEAWAAFIATFDPPTVLSLLSRLQALEGCGRAMIEDYQTSETHHPDHVLVPAEAFGPLRSLLSPGEQKEGELGSSNASRAGTRDPIAPAPIDAEPSADLDRSAPASGSRGCGVKEWEVILPIAGTAYVTVQAESEEAAIEEAMNVVTRDEIEEWDALHQIVKGNVCYAPTREASAQCVDEEDPDDEEPA